MSFAVAVPSPGATLGPLPAAPRRVAAVAAVGVLAWLAASLAWPALGARRSSSPPTRSAPAAEAAPFDPADVVEVARHPIEQAGAGLVVHDDAYSARFSDSGFSYRLTGATAELGVSLESVVRGTTAVPVDPGAWTGSRNVASRPISLGMTEQVTARDGEVEWDVVLASPPPGDGDLVVRGRLSGTSGPAVATEGGTALRIGLTGGESVTMGEVVVRDADDAVLHRSLPHVAGDVVELRVPASALDGARYPVTVDPTVIRTVPLTTEGNRYEPELATDGSNYLVVWQELAGSPASNDIYAIGVTPEGATSAVLPVATGTSNEYVPDVAWNGSSFLVVWELQFSATDTDILGRRVSNSWSTLGGAFAISQPTSFQHAPAVAANGATWLVTWQDARNADTDIFAARVDTNGGLLDPNGIPVSDDTLIAQEDAAPDVASNGSWWLVVWESNFNNGSLSINVRLMDSGGGLGVSNSVALFSQRPSDPAVASDGTKFMVAWEQPGESGIDIRGATVPVTNFAPELFTGEQFPIAVAADDQTDPAIAFRDTYLVAYRDRRSPPDPDVRATRVTSNGTVQDPSGFSIALTLRWEDTPSVAPGRDNHRWGVAYESGASSSTSAINFGYATK